MYLFDSLSNRSLFFINCSAMMIGYSISFETCLFKIKNSVNFYLCIIFCKKYLFITTSKRLISFKRHFIQ